MSAISRRGFVIATLIMLAATLAYPQDGRYGNARSLVARVQNDLRRAERFTPPNGKEKERYFNAQHHLSQFDRELERGRFDKDKLDEAIDDVKNVVENNTLSPRDRDVLAGDLRDLRELRRTRGASY
ncbi:MAG TPA: hypothetical protein VNH83_25500 [Bryobacteraceae bacterium]|nr:hypothetical protein [Bryobacteraceae bacterium]